MTQDKSLAERLADLEAEHRAAVNEYRAVQDKAPTHVVDAAYYRAHYAFLRLDSFKHLHGLKKA